MTLTSNQHRSRNWSTVYRDYFIYCAWLWPRISINRVFGAYSIAILSHIAEFDVMVLHIVDFEPTVDFDLKSRSTLFIADSFICKLWILNWPLILAFNISVKLKLIAYLGHCILRLFYICIVKFDVMARCTLWILYVPLISIPNTDRVFGT